MPAQKSTARGLFTAVAGTLGLSALAGVLVTIMVAPAIAVTGVTANNTIGIFDSLPEYIELDSGSQQNKIVAGNPADPATWVDIATIYKQNREEVNLDQISDYLECAAIAGEDRRFAEHGGVDLPSLIRAFVGQVTGNDEAGGASTLTMQLVRNILQQQALNDSSLTPEEQDQKIAEALAPTLDRKIKEMKLAIGLEKRYTKEEILQGYLNIAGFGGNTYGVQAAATEFFSKTAADVTVAEAASLIAIVQFPNSRSLNNVENFERNQERRDVILGWMLREQCITQEEYDEAIAIPVDENFINPSPARVGCLNARDKFEFICDYATRPVVISELEALGSTPEDRLEAWDRGGYTLVLTVNYDLQNVAWDTVNQWAPNNETRFELGAASSSVQAGTGWIISMAQNKNYDNRPASEVADPLTSTSVNFAADVAHGGSVGFQPGSTWKPYVLLAYLAAGNGVNESFNAGKLEVNAAAFADSCPFQEAVGGPPWGGQYKFRNDAGESGSYTVMRGTAGSVNSVFVQMAMRVDQCEIKRIAESIGVHNANGDPIFTNPACSIGGCMNNIDPTTLAASYAAIANHGVYCKPIIVQAVIGADGEPMAGQNAECGQSLVTPAVADTAAYAMAGVMSGTAGASRPRDGTPYIGKTGTTDKSVHTWMVGSSTNVATAVWVGNVRGEQALRNVSVNGTSASVLRHRIFRPIAEATNAYYPGGAFAPPDPALLTGTPTEVPSGLIGLSPEAARQAIELAELQFADGGEIDSDLPAGVVAATDPAPGSSVPRGTTVTIYRSNGQAVSVPNVVGMSEGAAVAALASAGFTNYDTRCVEADDLPPGPPGPPPADGTVLAQEPGAGAVVNKNTEIKLSVFQNNC